MLNGMLCSIVCSEKQSTTVMMMMMTLTLVSSGYQRSSLLVRDFPAQSRSYYSFRGSKCYEQHKIEKKYFEFEFIEFHKSNSNSNSKSTARRRVNKSWQWCYGACMPYTLYTLCMAPSFCQWLSLIIIIMGWFCIWHMKKKTKRNAKIGKKNHIKADSSSTTRTYECVWRSQTKWKICSRASLYYVVMCVYRTE